MISHQRQIAIVLIAGALSIPYVSKAAETDEAIASARRFVTLLSTGDCEQAHKMLNELMTRGLRPVDLDLSWHTQVFHFGKFRGIGEPTAKIDPGGIIVDLPLLWELGDRTLTVVMNPKGSVDGFAWGALEPDQKPAAARPNSNVKQLPVTIGTGLLALPGILTLPNSGEPRAAVLLIPDSGQNDADLTYGMHRPFKDLAEGFAERGIASLRYEQRTLKHAKYVDRSTLTVREEIMDDAASAWKTLRARDEFKGKPVYALGFSRAGTLLAETLGAADGVTGLILMAAVARPTEDALSVQMEYLAGLVTSTERKAQFEVVQEKLSRLRKRSLEPGDELFTLPASYWYDLMDRDGELAVSRTASFPGRILVIQGKRDFETTTDDFELWDRGLNKHPNTTLKLFDKLNHVFSRGEGMSQPDEYEIPKGVDQQAIDYIAEWLLLPPAGVGKTGS